jgi:hypothetical protein
MDGRLTRKPSLCIARRETFFLRKVLVAKHPDFAQSLHNLAGIYRTMGNYRAAEPLYLQALDISLVALGKRHPPCADSARSGGPLSNGAAIRQRGIAG